MSTPKKVAEEKPVEPQADAEMEALRTVAEALGTVDKDARTRIVQWAISFYGIYIPTGY